MKTHKHKIYKLYIYKYIIGKHRCMQLLRPTKLKYNNKIDKYYTNTRKTQCYIELSNDYNESIEILNDLFNITLYFVNNLEIEYGWSTTFLCITDNFIYKNKTYIHIYPKWNNIYGYIQCKLYDEMNVITCYNRPEYKYWNIPFSNEESIHLIKSLI